MITADKRMRRAFAKLDRTILLADFRLPRRSAHARRRPGRATCLAGRAWGLLSGEAGASLRR